MTFTNPAAWWLLSLALPIIALHILRPRREQVVVSSTMLWDPAERSVSASAPWQKLRSTWLLWAQLAAVALLAALLANPVRLTAGRLAQHTVFLIDASASMAALDGSPTRLEAAKDRAIQLREELPDGGLASVIAIGRDADVRLSASADSDAFSSAVRGITQSNGAPDAAGAFSLAIGMETAEAPIGFVLVSDGGFTDAEVKLLPPGTRYERVGSANTNRAITALGVQATQDGMIGRVSVRNTGGPAARQTVRMDVDGRTVGTKEVDIEAGGSTDVTMTLPLGDRIEAFLEGEDLLAADNHAFVTASVRPALKVLVAGPENPYLDAVLAVVPSIAVERVTEPKPSDGYDLAIYDRVAVPDRPGAPYIAIAAPSGIEGLTPGVIAEQPAITRTLSDHPLLSGLDLTGVGIAKAQTLPASGDTVLVGSEATPLLVTGSRAGRGFAAFGFELAQSNLPLQVAYPVLMDRLMRSLTGAGAAAADLKVGDTLPLPGGFANRVQAPGGARFDVPSGSTPHADKVGFWTLSSAGRPDRIVAVNVQQRESALTVPNDLVVVTGEGLQAKPTAGRGQRSILRWFAAGLLSILLLEAWLMSRQRAVGRRQTRWSMALRAVIALLVLAAALAPSIRVKRGDVALVLLVDGSDSMGAGGRAEAFAWVRKVLAEQPSSSRTAVAVFGATARLELTLQHGADLVGTPTKVDASATNLATGLRLARALAPSDSRRRVVIVSDGRPTTGDAAAEIDRLKADGVIVESHPVARGTGPDAAVVRVDVPSAVHPGETFDVRATVTAGAAGPARVALRADGAIVAEQTVTLVPGDNIVTFGQRAGAGPSTRYEIEVTSSQDSVPENDRGYAAVLIEGAPTVLIAEGRPGEASDFAAALRAGGLTTEVIAARDLPASDRLAAYAATVLVDVDVRTLSAQQVAGLTTATRDGGRGLVVLGGDRSFALGGYRNSPLEDLLPVISEITDPKRRLDVAQVLAIDTSGSMAACHCADGTTMGEGGMPVGGNMVGGGQDKTAISRAAAARTIQAMNVNDEVGVLAFNTEQNWVIPLQKLPAEDVVTKGLRTLAPEGGTNLSTPLQTAAASLRSSKAKLKHVILFTDGFTSQDSLAGLAEQAGKMAAEGITVSVLATGEVAYQQLEQVAVAGRGRFYAGKDLNEIPQIMAQEAVIAARDVIQEGSFLPRVTSSAAPVRNLAASPPVLGYLATTPKPTASTLLQVGGESDPLLASWRAGLGAVTAWTSDASARWSAPWAAWDGYVAFWSGVVKDTFALRGAGGAIVDARRVSDSLKITVDSAKAFPDTATAVARVARPDGTAVEVPLVRSAGGTFVGEMPAVTAGTYTVGALVSAADGPVFAGTALASQSYSAEYTAGASDPAYLVGLSARSGGRGAIEPAQAYDATGLPVGHRRISIAPWLLLAACLLWPFAVALSRLRRVGLARSDRPAAAPVVGGILAAKRTRAESRAVPVRPSPDRPNPAAASGAESAPAPVDPSPNSPNPTFPAPTAAQPRRSTPLPPPASTATARPSTGLLPPGPAAPPSTPPDAMPTAEADTLGQLLANKRKRQS